MDDNRNQNILTPEPNDSSDTPPLPPSEPPDQSNKDNTQNPNIIMPAQPATPDPAASNEPQVITPTPNPNTKKTIWSRLRPESILPHSIRNRLGGKARLVGSVLILVIVLLIGGTVYGLVNSRSKPTITKTPIASSFKYTVTAFKLVSTVPAVNATDVNPSTTITLNFNQPVTASKLVNNMYLTPNVNGTYSAGSNPDQVIFKPSTPFAEGTSVAVMVNGTYESNSGRQLGSPFEYKFTTSIPSNDVLFDDQNGLLDEEYSVASGQKAIFNLELGNDVSSGASVTLYKGNVNAMLSSLVYTPNYAVRNVDTANMTKLSTTSNISNNETYTVSQSDGLYVAVATNSSGSQIGFVWVDFSSFGVILRQDDQKIVADAQELASGTDVSASTTFYNLSGSVKQLSDQTISGLTTINLPFTPSVDLAVSTEGSEIAVIPINIPDSGGDIRVDQNLSTAQQVFGLTDKPTYSLSDIVKFAGYVRLDNDAQYTVPGSGTVNLYVASYKGGTPLATTTLSIGPNGTFNGTFTPSSNWIPSGQNFNQLQIFVASTDGNPVNDLPLASFVVTNQSNPAYGITVKFSQSSYLANNKISAVITATNSSGKPLANQSIDVHTFSEDYYENNPVANMENFGYVGDELPGSPTTLQLNSSGQATYTINASQLPADGQSQLVTVQANLPNQTGVGAAGGDSAIVHQGNAVLTFGQTRNDIPSGDSLISDVYATDLSGKPLTSATINYRLVDSSKSVELSSGTATTNASGLAVITIPSSQLSTSDSMSLLVSTVDSSGNTIGAATYYQVSPPGIDSYDTSGAGLYNLNVSGSSGQVNVGDTVNLTINAPSSIRAMVTMDRGRIYNPSMLSLNQGDNNYSFSVSPDLAPSFTLTFSYFLNGVYHSEGVYFNVSNPAKADVVKISPASQTVSANKSVSIPVQVTSSGSLPSNLIVDVVSANSYNLSSSVTPNILDVLFDSRPIMTSSSSSLTPVGSGGGRCGGGGGNLSSFANPVGTTLLWQPYLTTSSSGAANITITPPAGQWVINVYAADGSTDVGSASTTITAN